MATFSDRVTAESYREALLVGGPDAQTCFYLGRCLELQGKLERAAERRHRVEPGIAQLGGVPEVDVGIDYYHRSTPVQLRIADFGLRIRSTPVQSAIANPQSAIGWGGAP